LNFLDKGITRELELTKMRRVTIDHSKLMLHCSCIPIGYVDHFCTDTHWTITDPANHLYSEHEVGIIYYDDIRLLFDLFSLLDDDVLFLEDAVQTRNNQKQNENQESDFC
jgi:hypothetical protein